MGSVGFILTIPRTDLFMKCWIYFATGYDNIYFPHTTSACDVTNIVDIFLTRDFAASLAQGDPSLEFIPQFYSHNNVVQRFLHRHHINHATALNNEICLISFLNHVSRIRSVHGPRDAIDTCGEAEN